MVAASSDALAASVVEALFDDAVTELTDCAVSTGNVLVPDDVPPADDVSPPVVVEAATPDDSPEAPVLSGAGVASVALPIVDVDVVDADVVSPVVAEFAVAVIAGLVAPATGAAFAELAAGVPESPDELVDDDVPAPTEPAPLPLALPVALVDAPVADELDDPAPPVAVVLADAPLKAT